MNFVGEEKTRGGRHEETDIGAAARGGGGSAGPRGRQGQGRVSEHIVGARRGARRRHARRLPAGGEAQRRQARRPSRRGERGRRPAEAGDRPRGGRALHQARPCRPHHRHGVLQRAAAGHAGDPRLRHDLSQHQHRPRRLRGREVQPELLRRGLAERGHPRRHGRGDEPARAEERLPDRAQLSGRARDARRFQAILQGQDRRRGLRQARPARLRGGDRQHPRRQARRRVLLPAGRHGHQLRQAVRREPAPTRTPSSTRPASRPTRTRSRRSASR